MRASNVSSATIQTPSLLDLPIARICHGKGKAFTQISSLAKAKECLQAPILSAHQIALGVALIGLGAILEMPFLSTLFCGAVLIAKFISTTKMRQELGQIIAQATDIIESEMKEKNQQINNLERRNRQLAQQLETRHIQHARVQKNIEMGLEDIFNIATALAKGKPKELTRLLTAYDNQLATLRAQPNANIAALDLIEAQFDSLISLAEQFARVWGASTGQTFEEYTAMANQLIAAQKREAENLDMIAQLKTDVANTTYRLSEINKLFLKVSASRAELLQALAGQLSNVE